MRSVITILIILAALAGSGIVYRMATPEAATETSPARSGEQETRKVGGSHQRTGGDRELGAGQEAARTRQTKETVLAAVVEEQITCQCGEDCKCLDPMICKNGDCKLDYAIVFSGKWCAPCKKMHPAIITLQEEGYQIYYWDTDLFPEAAKQMKIGNVPTTIFFDGGKAVYRHTGILTESDFRSRLTPRSP